MSANFEETSIDFRGLELLLVHCKKLKSVSVDECVWTQFFRELRDGDEDGGSNGVLCADCVGPNERMAEISMSGGVLKNLPMLNYLFPNLTHLVVEGSRSSKSSLCTMEDTSLEAFNSLICITVIGLNFRDLAATLTGMSGERVTDLTFSGKNVTLDFDLVDKCCPNLVRLSVTSSTLALGGTTVDNRGASIFSNLKSLKLWEIRNEGSNNRGSLANVWRELIARTKNLESLFLWNIVIGDRDVDYILEQNTLPRLTDLRIGSSEIGFVRLTEHSVHLLIRTCLRLRSVGGVCDWNIRDLVSLLSTLLASGGWRICLE